MLYETSTLYTPCIPSALLYVTKQKKKLSGRGNGRPRISKRKNRKKRTKLKKFKTNNRHFAILSLFAISLRNEQRFPTPLPVTILFPSPRVLWQRKPKRISRLSLVVVPLWIRPKSFEHARLKKRIFILYFVELLMIANSPRFCQKKRVCTFKIERIKKSNGESNADA